MIIFDKGVCVRVKTPILFTAEVYMCIRTTDQVPAPIPMCRLCVCLFSSVIYVSVCCARCSLRVRVITKLLVQHDHDMIDSATIIYIHNITFIYILF